MIDQHGHIAALTQGARPEVVSAIHSASTRTGVDFGYLLEKAAAESSFDPLAQVATSSARGLYQFVDKTWLDTLDRHGARHGMGNVAKAITRDGNGDPVVADAATRQHILALRDNPHISALMAAELAQDNKHTLQQALGRDVGNTELYMAHFLGAGGAVKFLSNMAANPDIEASYIVPAAARSNQAVFYENGKALQLDEVFTRFAGKFQETPELAARSSPGMAPQPQALPFFPVPFEAPETALAAAPAAQPDSSRAALKAAIIAAPEPMLAAVQPPSNWLGRPQTPPVHTDVAMQLMALTLLETFNRSGDDDGNMANEWIV